MEQIKEFTILSVEMKGFKRFAEPFKADLGPISYITGMNGQGKTSLADAIAYAFCGTPLWGEKSCDRLLNHDCKETKVNVKFVDGYGELHELSRSRRRNTTEMTMDGNPIRQVDISKKFAEKDIFLSIFNPLYFIERLADDGSELLKRLLPTVSRESVMAALSDLNRGVLENVDISNPASYIKMTREDIRSLEDNNTYTDGQLDLLNSRKAGSAAAIDELTSRMKDLAEKKSKLEAAQFFEIDLDATKRRISDLSESLSKRRSELLERQAEIKMRQYVSLYTEKIADARSDLDGLYKKHSQLTEQVKSLTPGNCPTCGTYMSEANLLSIKEKINAEIGETVNAGKSARSVLDELKELDRKSREKFEEFRADDLKKVEDELSGLGITGMEITMLEDRLRIGNLTHAEYTELTELQAQYSECEKELAALNKLDNSDEEIDRLKGIRKSNDERIKSLQVLISAVESYAAKQIELLLSPLKMNRAAIKLYDVSKSTGEIKNVFKFTYDGKDYRWLSTSEKIRAGLEVADLLQRLTGLTYPTYIDNAECLTTGISRIGGQTIFAFARPGELRIQIPTSTGNRQEAAA